MKRCGICSRSYRGAGTIVLTAGGMRHRACATCARKAILVYTGDKVRTCGCGEPATRCEKCVDKVRRLALAGAVKGLRRKLESLKKAYVQRGLQTSGGTPIAVVGLDIALGIMNAASWDADG